MNFTTTLLEYYCQYIFQSSFKDLHPINKMSLKPLIWALLDDFFNRNICLELMVSVSELIYEHYLESNEVDNLSKEDWVECLILMENLEYIEYFKSDILTLRQLLQKIDFLETYFNNQLEVYSFDSLRTETVLNINKAYEDNQLENSKKERFKLL